MRKGFRWVVAGLATVTLSTVGFAVSQSSQAEPGSPGGPQGHGIVPTQQPSVDPEDAPVPDPLTVGIDSSASPARLIDRQGRSLYVFSLDRAATSACARACAADWLPVRSSGGKPQPGPGVPAGLVGNFQRPDGSEQVTYRGYPLYYSAADHQASDRRGENATAYGGRWTALPPPADAPQP